MAKKSNKSTAPKEEVVIEKEDLFEKEEVVEEEETVTNKVSNEDKLVKDIVKKEKETKRVYKDEDLIPCRSITSGGLYVEGDRTHYLYTWADYGDVVDVEYRDLIFMIRQNNKNVFEPRFIIEDAELVSQFKNLDNLYTTMYEIGDFETLLSLNVRDLEAQIKLLPSGAQNAFKQYVVTAIDNRTLDSVQKIKVIDNIFKTNLLLTLAQN